MFKKIFNHFRTQSTLSRRNFMFQSGMGAGVLGLSLAMGMHEANAQTSKEESAPAKPSPSGVYPRSLAHVGLTVPDIDAALDWYMDVFGWTRLMGPVTSIAKEGYMGELAVDLYGAEFKENRMAMLSTGNGCNVEFFEYVNPKTTKFKQQPGPWAPGFSHICVIDPDIEGMAKRITDKGGKQVSKIWDVIPDSKYPYQICYTQDPWGNFIEICTRHAEQLMAQFY